ncbi:MAG: HD domain-containing protein [Dehalococcoidales bacterium]|nr:MAG: HD domain-containing protein [Dehalococcoidales bacterium]
MKEIFEKIWETALPYQDQRDDDGHARITLKYAKELIKLEDGNEEIVIPAIILHDVGYSQIPRERRMLIFDKDAKKEEREAVRDEHQAESVKLGEKILQELNYSAEMIPEILEIISQHDSRKGFISKEEGLVRDADKLWRFSPEGFKVDANRSKSELEERCKRLEKDLKDSNYIYSKSAKKIARKELKERKKLIENLAD